MKRSFLLFTVLLFAIFCFGQAKDSKSIPFKEAHKAGLFTYSMTGVTVQSKFFGKCLRLYMSSKSDSSINIQLDRGLMLMCHDTDVQNMVHTSNALIALEPGETTTIELYAMCGEIRDHAPDRWKSYDVGNMSDAGLQSLVRLIDEEDMQNYEGQLAVWAYTDKATYRGQGVGSKSMQTVVSLLNRARVKVPLNAITETGKSGEVVIEDPAETEQNARVSVEETAVTGDPAEPQKSKKSFYYSVAALALLAGIVLLFFRKKRKRTEGSEDRPV